MPRTGTIIFKQPIAIAFALAGLKILLYLVAGSNYGYFRDELYFLACSDHLAWGYPDHAPLGVFLAWLIGSWLFVLRYVIRKFV